MSAKSDPRPASATRAPVTSEYYARRSMRAGEMVAAIAAGAAVGAMAFYVARIAMGRSRLVSASLPSSVSRGSDLTNAVDRSLRRPHVRRARNA